jgi:hypothetical protein
MIFLHIQGMIGISGDIVGKSTPETCEKSQGPAAWLSRQTKPIPIGPIIRYLLALKGVRACVCESAHGKQSQFGGVGRFETEKRTGSQIGRISIDKGEKGLDSSGSIRYRAK